MEEEKKTVVLALSGKGGVGKTSLAAAIVKELVEAYPDKRILAIDADPAVGLSTALGLEVEKTVDDIRKEAIKASEEGPKAVVETLHNAEWGIEEAMVQGPGFSFIAIGRPEAAGCYCKINTYLKDVIAAISKHFDYVVIDGEAGIEQVNRRVMEKVTHLLLVSDQSKKGRDVVKTIKSVADNLVMYEKVGVVANRLSKEAMGAELDFGGIPLLAKIPYDEALSETDLKGENVLALPETAPIVEGAKKALLAMEIIH